jgi:hypothetical protein
MNRPYSGPERRDFGRRPTNDHAIVRIPGRPTLRCVIKNISDGGALLDFGSEVWLPYNFQLVWETTGREEACEIKHRNGPFVGVFFQRNADVKETPNPRCETIRVDEVSPWIAETNHPRR